MSTIRVRIAPSPTGFFHIGNAKTALINWLFARSTGGTFLLRLEDTDTERSEAQYSDIICEALQWLGIDWDEGPAFANMPEKGQYGPYRQSERAEIHRREAQRLIDEGKAYRCFCTKEELDAEREKAMAEKRPPRYNGKCRDLTPEEIAAKAGTPFSVRFRVPEGVTVIDDLVQGTIRVENKEFDDFIIVKPNGDPVFHLAVVIDDGLMKITHVMRGDDHLTNAFRHVLLFQALGYDVPTFAHLPMVLDEQGKKYSKRLHGANVLDWREDGYLPETIVNYLVLLGWTPEEEGRELFTREELVKAFTIDRLGKSAAKFDLKKLQWLNGQHIRRMSAEELRDRVVPILEKAGFDTSTRSSEWLTHMAAICQEKIPTLNDIVGYTDFFFVEPATYDEKAVKKQWEKEDALERMEKIVEVFKGIDPWNHDTIKGAFDALVEKTGVALGQFVHPTRLALTGKSVGPGLFELTELLGKDTALARMQRAIEFVRARGGAVA
ncbi:MAG: glutamate--tRNA ligase [Candidatus Hydrogenedentes bacterium]|nr:glutamate--tRNA ligase [Candidatus Hydrogenedentota bacterium]